MRWQCLINERAHALRQDSGGSANPFSRVELKESLAVLQSVALQQSPPREVVGGDVSWLSKLVADAVYPGCRFDITLDGLAGTSGLALDGKISLTAFGGLKADNDAALLRSEQAGP